jgi:hypothetical protein
VYLQATLNKYDSFEIGCRSQIITSKPVHKARSIVFLISLSININYFPKNMVEVSFRVINTDIRSLGRVSRNLYESSHSDSGVAFLVLTVLYFAFLRLFSYTYFLKKTQQKKSRVLHLEAWLTTVTLEGCSLLKISSLVAWLYDTECHPVESLKTVSKVILHGQRCCDHALRC